MPPRDQRPSPSNRARIVADARGAQTEREKSYRERALALYPHVCGRCGREFSGKRLRELTVHHRDHDHGNNPPDGSNWELLCLYCHDNEHQNAEQRDHYDGAPATALRQEPTLGHSPFEGLLGLLPKEDEEE